MNIICADEDELAIRVADFIAASAREAVRQRRQFSIALSGGSTPERSYALLTPPERRAAVPWSKTRVFFSDERFVPHSDARSNYAMAHRSLLAHVPLPPSQIFPVPTERKSAAAAAAAYAQQLAAAFATPPGGPPPRFDLILLGLGEDGHTASLFPGAAALQTEDAWVTWSPPGTLPPLVDRVTFTFPLIDAARQIAFLAAGEKKAAAVREALQGGGNARDHCPAAAVQPADGVLTWFLDRAAAKGLV